MNHFSPHGTNLFGEPAEPATDVVARKFIVPPFTVLDTKQGYWQDRKRAWLSLGIHSEEGRTARAFNIREWTETTDGVTPSLASETSTFDPVLCELVYRWFCPQGGHIVDPFAGGSVRGIVAGSLGFHYTGVELRAEQVAANETQADDIAPQVRPQWITGDSFDMVSKVGVSDLVFSCPPYADLEVYSDDPNDLSVIAAQDYHAFVSRYRHIIARTIANMRDDRFAVFVVGDVRDRRGYYRNFVSDTIAAFQDCGARLYNEAVLINSVGTLAMRVTKQFDASRKMGKQHQNVLVFVKGDPKRATREIDDRGKTPDTAEMRQA